jgi:ribosomal-protein-alanine N-acetyltransferase
VSDIEVREMRWTDIPAVHRIESASFPHSAWSVESFWSELAGVPETRWYAVATEGHRLVGYSGLMAVGADADVQTIAVDETRRGRGIGGLLLDALLEEAARRGCTTATLEVEFENAAAQSLYRARGFEQIARRSAYYGPGRDAVVMRRRLRGGGGGA